MIKKGVIPAFLSVCCVGNTPNTLISAELTCQKPLSPSVPSKL